MSMQGFMENVQAFVDAVSENLDRTSEKIKGKDPGFAALPKDKKQILIYFSPNNVSSEITASYANLKRKGKGVTSTNVRFWTNEFKKLLKSGTLEGFTEAAIKYFGEDNLKTFQIEVSEGESAKPLRKVTANPDLTGENIKNFFSMLQQKSRSKTRPLFKEILPEVTKKSGAKGNIYDIYDVRKGIMNRNILEIIGAGQVQEDAVENLLNDLMSTSRFTISQFYLAIKNHTEYIRDTEREERLYNFTAKRFEDLNDKDKETVENLYGRYKDQMQEDFVFVAKDSRLFRALKAKNLPFERLAAQDTDEYQIFDKNRLKSLLETIETETFKRRAIKLVDDSPEAFPDLPRTLKNPAQREKLLDDIAFGSGGSFYKPSSNVSRAGGVKFLQDIIATCRYYVPNSKSYSMLRATFEPEDSESLSGDDPDSRTGDAEAIEAKIDELAKQIVKEVTIFKNNFIQAFKDKMNDIQENPEQYSSVLSSDIVVSTLKQSKLLL